MIDDLEKALHRMKALEEAWDELDDEEKCPTCGCVESGCIEVGCLSEDWEDFIDEEEDGE